MAHIQTSHLNLWKPQDLAVDKISSQKMFVDNIDVLEEFAVSMLKRSAIPVTSIAELKAIDTSDITIYTDGTTVMVKSNGLYFFDRGNINDDNGSTIIAPTTGGGRWVSISTFFGKLAFKDSLSKSDIGLSNVPNVATNDQTPTYTQATSIANLISGEKLSVSMGKIMKVIADFITHLANKSNPHEVTKTQVGLSNVDNTSDANKPISNAQATAIADAKSAGTSAQINLASHIGTKSNPHEVTKAQVGLGSVPNVSTNNQTPTYTQATTLANLVSGETLTVSMGKIMRGLAELITHLASKSNPHTVTKIQVGLGNVDNTSDANKPISNATQTALSAINSNLHGSVQSVADLRAIDTSDTTLFKNGTLIMVQELGLFTFNRSAIGGNGADGNAIIAPITGGGGWVPTTPSDIPLSGREASTVDQLDTILTNALMNMSSNAIKYVIVNCIQPFAPFGGGIIHMTIYKTNNSYAVIEARVYNSNPNMAWQFTRSRYNGTWGPWHRVPYLDESGKITLDQLPSGVMPASIE